ncbi:hypothetical protein COV05_03080 [Candidatus Uhrbacteria bacterium CG10_big_fil_rev_8_21_14_0_10_48_16]|uniref:Uncharacterized protein n=1 Tax=Candidatus Uhrbacteria bacterium CG10_big_fil_rev_8_21_14_0_10_48_16 TaxID=1975038 RepID=A0A2M8LGZ8_9BACT|nr:MAG: hypothetical protein COV05_03080 [Candidatus Uhrbacteria bacterium CG10_big_fil_rev_8_21_14_0_10_48_16]
MLEFLTENWLALLLVLAVGVALGAALKAPGKKLFLRFFAQLLIVKGYWKFVLPFFLFSVLAYFMVLNYAEEFLIDRYISILSHFVTLVFAIFVGYFAFLQVAENRLEKFKEEGLRHISQKSWARAKKYYEKIYVIDPTDFGSLANLLEVYLMLSDYNSFNEKISHLEKEVEDKQDKIIIYYLKVAKPLLQQDLGTAKSELGDCISFIKDNPELLVKFSWNFGDIKQSDVYKGLDGESKKIFDNFVQYLTRSLGEENKAKFEKADYVLEEPSATNGI